MRRTHYSLPLAALLCFAASGPLPAADASVDCRLTFSLSSWSAIYSHAEGQGTVTCDNGESLQVVVRADGGGITVGKFRVENGTGRFTNVGAIADVLGSYAQGEVSGGVVKSGTAQVLTKGRVSLALAGAGMGSALGISFGRLTLSANK
jgi:hypothetical protein